MQFRAVAISFLAAAVAAQNSTDSSLTDLVSQLPTCAIPCFEDGASAANCSTTDFECLCGSGKQTFISSAGVCLLTSSCSSEDQASVSNIANEICQDVAAGNVSDTDQAAASSVVSSALSAAATETNTPDDAAVRPEMGYGVFGAAAIAAMWAL
ncbi:hypothetical protein F5Y18DRAFT_428016 [Xylariaceae sp. FL1019]|nr:hypothetical protein F5Y18DRAFT_428016 [Xylariaceae sp. FL1019]